MSDPRLSERYLVVKGTGPAERYYWQPTKQMREAGWHARRVGRGKHFPDALNEARALNADLDAWLIANSSSAPRKPPGKVTFSRVIELYLDSPRFTGLRPRTQKDYRNILARLAVWAGDMPIKDIGRAMVQRFYEHSYQAAPAQAAAMIRVARVVFGYALDHELIEVNPASKPRIKTSPPRLVIFTTEEINALLAAAAHLAVPSIGDAILLGLYTGQREGDILDLRDSSLRGRHVYLKQSKTRANVEIPMAPKLMERMVLAARRRSNECIEDGYLVTYEATGRQYSGDHFRHVFARVRIEAALAVPSIIGKFFMDLRDTAVTRLAEADCTIPQICSITGHSEGAAHSIMKHYLALTGDLAEQAIEKLVAHEKAVDNG